jgi:hypothetical protein
MNNTTLIIGVVVLVFVFMLTYDPKTRRLEKYLTSPGQAIVQEKVGQDPECESDRYHELQFNSKSNGEGCMGEQLQYKGAII